MEAIFGVIRAICTLPNATSPISGVEFEAGPQGLVSRPLTTEEAARFGVIPGYRLVYDEPEAEPKPTKRPRGKSDES